MEPYQPIPGKPPRKVVIDRQRKLFASLDIEELLLEFVSYGPMFWNLKYWMNFMWFMYWFKIMKNLTNLNLGHWLSESSADSRWLACPWALRWHRVRQQAARGVDILRWAAWWQLPPYSRKGPLPNWEWKWVLLAPSPHTYLWEGARKVHWLLGRYSIIRWVDQN